MRSASRSACRSTPARSCSRSAPRRSPRSSTSSSCDPIPLRTAAALSAAQADDPKVDVALPTHDRGGVRTGMISIALSHATMVAVMAMTPVHLTEHGATLVVVGITISLHVAGMFALSPRLRHPVRPDRQTADDRHSARCCCSRVSSPPPRAPSRRPRSWSRSSCSGWAGVRRPSPAPRSSPSPPTRLHRTRTQGRADLLMSSVGAAGGALAGPVLALIGYSGLALGAMAARRDGGGVLAIRWLSLRDAARPAAPS